MLTLKELEAAVRDLAGKIGAPDAYLPNFGHHQVDAHPHVEVDASGYHWIVIERGDEQRRRTTCELDDILYTIFDQVTLNLSMDYEFRHRVRDQDARRVQFQTKIHLLSLMSQEWAKRGAEHQEQVLQQYPFDDRIDKRIELTRFYQTQGYSQSTAEEMATEKYPLPPDRPLCPKGPYR
jgi:hypothetical protein